MILYVAIDWYRDYQKHVKNGGQIMRLKEALEKYKMVTPDEDHPCYVYAPHGIYVTAKKHRSIRTEPDLSEHIPLRDAIKSELAETWQEHKITEYEEIIELLQEVYDFGCDDKDQAEIDYLTDLFKKITIKLDAKG